MFTSTDEKMMRRAIDLAYKPVIAPYPNPRVGAVIAQGSRIISEGYHASYSSPHAEFSAISKLNFIAKGATIYVTLEPCSPFPEKRNPSCAELIAKSGISRCVIGSLHPIEGENKGVEILENAGVVVEHGLLENDTSKIVRGLFYAKTYGKPFVIAKWAMTADGLIAPPDRSPGAISGNEAKTFTHSLRHQCDGVLVGIGTAKNDNPMLDCRNSGFRHPTRIVIDPYLEIPTTHHLANPTPNRPTMLIHSSTVSSEKIALFADKHVILIPLLEDEENGFPVGDILSALYQHNLFSILIEGGSSVLGRFFDEKAINEVHVIVAPKIMGGANSLSAVGGVGTKSIHKAIQLEDNTVATLGKDVLISGKPKF